MPPTCLPWFTACQDRPALPPVTYHCPALLTPTYTHTAAHYTFLMPSHSHTLFFPTFHTFTTHTLDIPRSATTPRCRTPARTPSHHTDACRLITPCDPQATAFRPTRRLPAACWHACQLLFCWDGFYAGYNLPSACRHSPVPPFTHLSTVPYACAFYTIRACLGFNCCAANPLPVHCLRRGRHAAASRAPDTAPLPRCAYPAFCRRRAWFPGYAYLPRYTVCGPHLPHWRLPDYLYHAPHPHYLPHALRAGCNGNAAFTPTDYLPPPPHYLPHRTFGSLVRRLLTHTARAYTNCATVMVTWR